MDETAWQTQLSTVRERNQYAHNKSLFCDVEFSVVDSNGDKVSIPAHKYVLAISSPVFEAMFYGQLAETGRTIHLQDCTKEGLQEMLRYVYSDEIQLTGSNVMEVLYLADKYMMPFVVEKCREYLEKELGPEDVFSVLPLVQKKGDEKLEQHCWNIVDSETQRAVCSEPFLNTSREMLCQILGRDSLRVKELDLFQAVDKWVSMRIEEKRLENNGERKRAILGEEVIRLIRFPLMSQKEFAEKVLPSGLLQIDEVTELIQIYHSIPTLTKAFSARKRLSNLEYVPRIRFQTIGAFDDDWNYYDSNTCDAINLTVSKTISLVGVRLFGSAGSSYDVDLCIYKSDQKISTTSLVNVSTEGEMIDGLYYGYTIKLDKPVKLEPGRKYTVEAEIAGPHSYYGEDGVATVQCGDLVVTYSNFRRASNGTSTKNGQFPTFVFANL